MLSTSTNIKPSLITEPSQANVQLAVQGLLDDPLRLYTTFPWEFKSIDQHTTDELSTRARALNGLKITLDYFTDSSVIASFNPGLLSYTIQQLDIINYKLDNQDAKKFNLEPNDNKPHVDKEKGKDQYIVLLGTIAGTGGTRLWTPKNEQDPSAQLKAFKKLSSCDGYDIPALINNLENESTILEVGPNLGVAFRVYSTEAPTQQPCAIHNIPPLTENRTAIRAWVLVTSPQD